MDENDLAIINAVNKSNNIAEGVQKDLSTIIDKIKSHYIPTILSESSDPDGTKSEFDKLVQEIVTIKDNCGNLATQDEEVHRVHTILTGRRESSIRMEEKIKWLSWMTDMMRELFSALCTKQALSGNFNLSGSGNWPILNKEGYSSGSNGNMNAYGSGTVEEKETRPQIGKPLP